VGIKETLTSGMSREVIIVMVLLAMTGLWAWAFGKVPIDGEHGFVMRVTLSDDVKTIVGKDVEGLKKQSQETSQKVDNIKIALDRILADYYSKRIKDATRQRCKLPLGEIAERDRLWDQINGDVNLYRQYSGDTSYQRPTCQDV